MEALAEDEVTFEELRQAVIDGKHVAFVASVNGIQLRFEVCPYVANIAWQGAVPVEYCIVMLATDRSAYTFGLDKPYLSVEYVKGKLRPAFPEKRQRCWLRSLAETRWGR